jgi:3-dehydroquinate dehydratase I
MFLTSKTLICVPIRNETSSGILESIDKAIIKGADLLELRIDAMKDPDPQEVASLMKGIPHPLIATNRMKEEGGFYEGSKTERTEILLEAAKYADYVDIELRTEDKYRSKIIKASKSTIISYHNFKKTPSVHELLKIVKSAHKLGDIAKFAVMPSNLQDTLRVLEVLSQVNNTIGIAMGDLGRYTRVVAPLFGSPITYASLINESAPGQMNIETTKNIIHSLKIRW